MARKDINNLWDRDMRNAINDNFIELYNEYTQAGLNAKEAKEKAVQAVADSLLAKDIAETTRQEMINIIREQTEGGDIVPEVVQARGNEATLGNRLNSIDSNLAQIDEDKLSKSEGEKIKNENNAEVIALQIELNAIRTIINNNYSTDIEEGISTGLAE